MRHRRLIKILDFANLETNFWQSLRPNDFLLIRLYGFENRAQMISKIQKTARQKRINLIISLNSNTFNTLSHLPQSISRKPIKKKFSTSCHKLQEVHQAKKYGIKHAFLSPIFHTQTHPDVKPMGILRFFSIANSMQNIRIIALGGLDFRKIKQLERLDFQQKIWAYAGIRGL